jgi:diaminohydroxyphosphoribosylaminopyrimidine deaminase/5-amino-6-(5-phosphoribosylamino)uracil reductase
MAHALMLGRRALGTTAENPAVGCVIVDAAGTVAGVGWTQPGGRPHAETQALGMAGGRARGGTAYVTLEPCNHHGRTPPCSGALIAAGVARVVIAAADPHPEARGGAAALAAAGIAVTAGLLADEASRALAGFLTRIAKKRPQVILKLAVSADGYIAASGGARTAISGPEANARVHLMRAEADAVMIGAGTALADDPLLTCRLPGMTHRSPRRIVLDSALRLPLSSALVRTATETPVTVVHAPDVPADRATALAAAGVGLLPAPRGAGGLDLAAVLARLGEARLNTVLAEGGARLASALLCAGLVDRLVIVQSDRALGGGVPALASGTLDGVLRPGGPFALTGVERLGDDTLRQHDRTEG